MGTQQQQQSSATAIAMGTQQQQQQDDDKVELLIQRVSRIHTSISKLPTLTPSDQVNALFSELVLTCLPPSSLDVANLPHPVQQMRSDLIRLCGEAEALLEAHYSDILASYDDPLAHLDLFPYYSNYVKLSHLEHALLARHVAGPPPRHVAFVGSGPLPLSSLVLASRHLRAARFANYDVSAPANARAARLLRGGALGARVAFHTADVRAVTRALAAYDVVFLAALVGIERDEKAQVVEHLARHMAPGAALVARSAHGARAFLYPVVDEEDLIRKGFEVLAVHHPEDEVINSVIVARKSAPPPPPPPRPHGHGHSHVQGQIGLPKPCKCCEMQAMSQLGHGGMMDEVALEELSS